MVARAESVLWGIAVVVAAASCRTPPASPTPQANAKVLSDTPRTVAPGLSPRGDIAFRLVAHGPQGQEQFVKGTDSCCDELRAGWMVWRGQSWLAVDTLAQRLAVPTGGERIARAGPFFIRADSGRLARTLQGGRLGDTVMFLTLRDPLLPMSGAIGVLVRDTLVIRAAASAEFAKFEWAETRFYVRVRP